MSSAIYTGTVRHSRLRPARHAFSYRVFYLYLDLDEIDSIATRLRWFSHNRFNLFAFHDADHGPDDGTPVREWIDRVLADAGITLGRGRVRLLSYPRVLGHVFNPISVWYCFDESERLGALVYEVRNTFGDKHSYVVPVDASDRIRHTVQKRLHVSPFMDMDQTYDFTIAPPGDRLTLGIVQTDSEGPIFRAGLATRRGELGDRALLRAFFTIPLVTLKTIAAIHLQAVPLWLKRVGVRRRPRPPAESVTNVGERVA